MKSRRIILKSIAIKTNIRVITGVLLLFVFSILIISCSFLYSTNTYISSNERYNISMRTLIISKPMKDSMDVGFTAEELDRIAELESVVSVFPGSNHFSNLANIRDNNDRETAGFMASFIGIDENSLPNDFEFKDYTYDMFEKNGAIVPDTIYTLEGKAISTKEMSGETLASEIIQYDLLAEVSPVEAPPVLAIVQTELTIVGVYDMEKNCGGENRIFISAGSIAVFKEAFWQGYGNGDRFATVIVDNYLSVKKVQTILNEFGYETDPASFIDQRSLLVFRFVSVALVVTNMLIYCGGIIIFHRNSLEKCRDQLNTLSATGFTIEQICLYYTISVVGKTTASYVEAAFICFAARHVLGKLVFGDANGFKIQLVIITGVLLLILLVAIISSISKLIRYYSSPMLIRDEQ